MNQPPPGVRDARAVILDFVTAHARRPVPGTGLSRLIGQAIPQATRPHLRRAATRLVAPRERRRAKRHLASGTVKLNLGCGSLPLDGWVNVDLIGLPVDVAWDIGRALPLPDASVDAIFHEHVLEHLEATAGYTLLQECFRLLKPGGVMRAVIPDASKYIHSYCDPDHVFLKSWREIDQRGLPPLLGLQEEFYNFGHRTIYDFETFALFCRAAGFEQIEERTFGNSRVSPCPDSEWRKVDSFYADVIK